jgi:hypothetical protein
MYQQSHMSRINLRNPWQAQNYSISGGTICFPMMTLNGRGVQTPVARSPGHGDAEYFGSSVSNLLHVALLAPKILKCNLDFWKICAPLLNGILLFSYVISSGGAVGWDTALQAERSRVRFPMVSLEFFIDIILPAALRSWGRLSL